MSEERAFEGVWISASLWLDKSLTMQEKVMLVEIKSLSANPVRGCFKSNKAFAEFFGVSTSRVSQILTSLEEKGYINLRHKREGKRVVERNIFLSEMHSKNQPDLFRKPKGGYLENLNNPVRNPKGGYLGFLKERNTLLSNTVENNTIGTNPELPEVDPIDSEFEQLWKSYPKRAGGNPKGEALKVYRKQRKSHPLEEFQSGLERYRRYCEQSGKIGTEFVMQAKRFFGAGKHWREEYSRPANNQQGVGNENRNSGAGNRLQQQQNQINAAFARASAREAAPGPVETHGAAVWPQVDVPVRAV
ncbi:helix-turn-helix domain-containing protein [Microbulbifer sp. OS29]|uniref:Helix-turn-helix domain-containing protein n=1 Tax=Microbulbifer okhotskensis TaxID=2926617 RepID=A0A9X2EQZ9_9GAMM|nr:helix-turn-helix domain-containing protein [Microbulbifer okhotskensis]MCO1336219.1 helix-turn-helix domain-containing protein [Microbulbifer okhotskensis]